MLTILDLNFGFKHHVTIYESMRVKVSVERICHQSNNIHEQTALI